MNLLPAKHILSITTMRFYFKPIPLNGDFQLLKCSLLYSAFFLSAALLCALSPGPPHDQTLSFETGNRAHELHSSRVTQTASAFCPAEVTSQPALWNTAEGKIPAFPLSLQSAGWNEFLRSLLHSSLTKGNIDSGHSEASLDYYNWWLKMSNRSEIRYSHFKH